MKTDATNSNKKTPKPNENRYHNDSIIHDQIKQHSINDLLQNHYQLQPQHQSDKGTKYLCPVHGEKTPSFNVFTSRKDGTYRFKCHGCDAGGDIINLVMAIDKVSFGEAKDKLKTIFSFPQEHNKMPYPTNKLQPKKPTTPTPPKDTRTIKKVQPIENKALLSYLHSRGITELQGVEEIYYTLEKDHKVHNLFGVAFENDSKGFEVSSKNPKGGSFKTAFGTKDITTILNNPSSKSIKIFEGFMDYLSYLQMKPQAKISNFIILNSVSLYEDAITAIKGNYELIELYLDSDEAGDKYTFKFIDDIRIAYCGSKIVKIVDHRKTYEKYKDVNDYLLSRRSS